MGRACPEESMARPKRLMNAEQMEHALTLIAEGVVGSMHDAAELALVGIHTRGVPLARRIADKIVDGGGPEPPVGTLDISLYRDDLSQVADQPILRETDILFELESRRVVLVDDVIFTGRTIRAALDALTDLGRPRAILLAVMVDRGGRELPIHPDVVGMHVEAGDACTVDVRLESIDRGRDRIELRRLERDSRGGGE